VPLFVFCFFGDRTMKTFALWVRLTVVLLVVGTVASSWGSGAPLEYVKSHTFQNLAPNPCKFTGHYLAIDDLGQPVLSVASNKFDSESYWEIKYLFWKERGYAAHAIVQRGNNKFNGKYLCIDSATGKLGFANEPIGTARWLIRYTGKYSGWDAFHIQNLSQNGTFDMAFLAIDETTGEVILSPKPTPGSHWFMNDTAYLPAETMIP
jgi:hypothetical protein